MVKPSEELKLLGVWLDLKLDSKAYIQKVEAKSAHTVVALKTITGLT